MRSTVDLNSVKELIWSCNWLIVSLAWQYWVSNVEYLLEVMKGVSNRNCYFLDCLTFYDGNEYHQFFGISKGVLSNELRGHETKRAKSNLCWIMRSFYG